MNKYKYLVVFICLMIVISSTSCFLFNLGSPSRAQLKYIPEELNDLYLGMPFAEFSTKKDITAMERSDLFSFRFQLIEEFKDPNIKEVTYYFENENNPQKPLYEMIIEYESEFDLPMYIQEKYGPPNHEDEWRFDSQEGFEIMVWSFDSKLVIAGKIKGTEWE